MEKLTETKNYIQNIIKNFVPEIGIILGSGLGALPDEYNCIKIPYNDIPNFQKPSVEGHQGQLCFCEIEGKNVVIMQGRYHYYEGYSMEQVTYPVKVMKLLGVKKLILTNASGTLNKDFLPGDIILIKDHINFIGLNPLVGKNNAGLGERFPDMSNIYNNDLRAKVFYTAKEQRIPLKEGVYMAMTGPSYETPAEVRMAKILGADLIGMSTVPEAIVANYCGIKVIGISCITNYAAGISDKKLTHKEVIETANMIENKFKTLIKAIIRTV